MGNDNVACETGRENLVESLEPVEVHRKPDQLYIYSKRERDYRPTTMGCLVIMTSKNTNTPLFLVIKFNKCIRILLVPSCIIEGLS